MYFKTDNLNLFLSHTANYDKTEQFLARDTVKQKLLWHDDKPKNVQTLPGPCLPP